MKEKLRLRGKFGRGVRNTCTDALKISVPTLAIVGNVTRLVDRGQKKYSKKSYGIGRLPYKRACTSASL